MTAREAGPVAVFCADDNEAFRGLVRSLVTATSGFVMVGEAASAEEALILITDTRPDLVLMDIRMPGMSGVRAAEILSKTQPRLRVVLMSANPAEAQAELGPLVPPVTVLDKAELSTRRLSELRDGDATP
ncbi:MAG TPA: response regulator [Solirubrobacteraceae bacterium]|nr:response regulator [Solirubrobacteraceae bacterium]